MLGCMLYCLSHLTHVRKHSFANGVKCWCREDHCVGRLGNFNNYDLFSNGVKHHNQANYYTPTTKWRGGAILDSLCRVGRSVCLEFVTAL